MKLKVKILKCKNYKILNYLIAYIKNIKNYLFRKNIVLM